MPAPITPPLYDRPPLWQTSEISRLNEIQLWNATGFFQQNAKFYSAASDAGETLVVLHEGFIAHESATLPPAVAHLITAARRSYFAAFSVALAGFADDTFVLLRSFLERCAYACTTAHVELASDIWADRDKDAASKKAVRGLFRPEEMVRVINKRQEGLGDEWYIFYNKLIDSGAHPNPRIMLSDLHSPRDEYGIQTEFSVLNSDPAVTEFTFAALVGNALVGFRVLEQTLGEALFQELGLPDRLDRIDQVLRE